MAGLPSSGSLQKAYLKIGQPGDNNTMGSVEKTIEFMFNPKEISITKTANYSTPPAGKSSQPQYLGTKPQAITVEMFFDASEKGDVTSKIEDLFKALSPHPSTVDEHPTPSFCMFGWGTQTYISNAVIKSAAVKYTRFKPDGTPIRAIATVSLEELPPVKTATNPTSGSPDSNVERIVRPGDTLASIANQELGSPTLWRVVAEANAVDDPFRLPPGTSLIIPSLTALEAGRQN
jgi:nucleoid-associated protein YgaU